MTAFSDKTGSLFYDLCQPEGEYTVWVLRTLDGKLVAISKFQDTMQAKQAAFSLFREYILGIPA